MPALASCSRGDYLIGPPEDERKSLVYVLRVEDSGDVLVEDALTEVLFYIDKVTIKGWERVTHGA